MTVASDVCSDSDANTVHPVTFKIQIFNMTYLQVSTSRYMDARKLELYICSKALTFTGTCETTSVPGNADGYRKAARLVQGHGWALESVQTAMNAPLTEAELRSMAY
jgi:hypothetical protein